MIRLARWAGQQRLLRTEVDSGPRRLQRRLRYELRQRVDRKLPPQLALALAGGLGPTPTWQPERPSPTIKPPPAPASQGEATRAIRFTFLNEQRQLGWPIAWNDPAWPRLW